MFADIEEMEEMDAYELHARRRDEWNNLLHLLNISHFSSTYCAKKIQPDKLPQNDGEKDAGTKRRRKEVWQNRNLQ